MTTPVLATAAVPAGEAATITLTNPHGLHARPAARLVAALAPFAASLTLVKDGQSADPRSLNQLTALQARQGDSLTLYADGADSAAALAAFRDLAAANFGDSTTETLNLPTAPISAALYHDHPPVIPADLRADRAAFTAAVDAWRAHLGDLRKYTSARYGDDAGDIFAAQQQLLDELAANTLARAENETVAAWRAETAAAITQFAAIRDPYLRARVLDFADIADGVLAALAHLPPPPYPEDSPFILATARLYPSAAAVLPDNCVAVILDEDDSHSHSAILCRHAARPLLSGIDTSVPDGTVLTLNPQPQEQP